MKILAQVAADNPGLYIYGPLGIFCAFLMWALVALQKTHSAEIKSLVAELKDLRHSIYGLQKIVAVQLSEHAHAGTYEFRAAQEVIAKVDARMRKDE